VESQSGSRRPNHDQLLNPALDRLSVHDRLHPSNGKVRRAVVVRRTVIAPRRLRPRARDDDVGEGQGAKVPGRPVQLDREQSLVE